MKPGGIEIYLQANYLARKHFYVEIHELPDGKRRDILTVAKKQMAEFYGA
jgi:hypothetical protein